MQKNTFIIAAALGCLISITAPAARCEAGHGLLHTIAMYVPNRALDILDIFRIRIRVGPGGIIGVRATELASVSYGLYETIYVGLPGPRKRPMVKLPIGIETYDGIHLMGADIAEETDYGPDYSPTEIGVGIQVLFVGFDIGVDPLIELADLLAGVFAWDLRGDDL